MITITEPQQSSFVQYFSINKNITNFAVMSRLLNMYKEECNLKGRILTFQEFDEDIENSIGYDSFYGDQF